MFNRFAVNREATPLIHFADNFAAGGIPNQNKLIHSGAGNCTGTLKPVKCEHP
jgi:hypothetical protein